MATHSSILAWRIPGMGEAWWTAVYGVAHLHMTIFKVDNQQELHYSTWNSARYVAAWMERKFGGEWKHVHAWLKPFAVHLKLSQLC